MKNWIEQTSKIQKEMGGIQFIDRKKKTQVSIGKFFYSAKPNNWEFQATGKEEALKGYPHSKVGITKKEAIKLLRGYMKKF
jgi:hypothetical protein